MQAVAAIMTVEQYSMFEKHINENIPDNLVVFDYNDTDMVYVTDMSLDHLGWSKILR